MKANIMAGREASLKQSVSCGIHEQVVVSSPSSSLQRSPPSASQRSPLSATQRSPLSATQRSPLSATQRYMYNT